MDKIWLARKYLSSGSSSSSSRSSSSSSNSRVTTSTIYAMALSASVDGTVTIEVDDTELTVPCVCSVDEGQRAVVSLLSGSPVVIGAAGYGDQVATALSTVAEGAEIASNHLYYDETYGLIVCTDAEDPHSGISTQIQASGLSIRSGTTALAQFTPDTIYLGKGSDSAVIDLINGTGEIRQETEELEAWGTSAATYQSKVLKILTEDGLFLDAGDSNSGTYETIKLYEVLQARDQDIDTGVAPVSKMAFAGMEARVSADDSASGSDLTSRIAVSSGGFNADKEIAFYADDFTVNSDAVFAACTAISTNSSLSLSAGTLTQVPLTGFSVRKGTHTHPSSSTSSYSDSRFEISNNGVVCTTFGYALVSGSVYINASSGVQAGCYVYVDGEEVTGTYFVTGGSTSVKSGAVVVPVSIGSVITLRARASSATTATPSNVNTYLSVVFV